MAKPGSEAKDEQATLTTQSNPQNTLCSTERILIRYGKMILSPITYLAQAHSIKDIEGVIKTVEDTGDNFVLKDEVDNDVVDKKDYEPVKEDVDSLGSSKGKDRFNTYVYVREEIFNKILF